MSKAVGRQPRPNGLGWLACWLLALALPGAAAAAEVQPALPMRLGVWVPIGIGIENACAYTPPDVAVTWDGHQLIGLGREIVEVKLLSRSVFLPGYTQPGPRYLVRTKAEGGGGETTDEKWTFAGTDTVVVNADPIRWCAKSLAEFKHMRGEKP